MKFRSLILALLALVVMATPAAAQVPGCVNGVLADPRAYVLSQINRQEGAPANDFAGVLKQLQINGMRINPKPGERQPLDAPYFGITLMVGADGGPRGRIWLPTDVPESGGWYTHEVQVIGDAPGGGLQWAWKDIGGAPYAPRPCSGVTPAPVEPPVTPQPPDATLLARLEALEQQVKDLRARLAEVSTTTVLDAHVRELIEAAIGTLVVRGETDKGLYGTHRHTVNLAVTTR